MSTAKLSIPCVSHSLPAQDSKEGEERRKQMGGGGRKEGGGGKRRRCREEKGQEKQSIKLPTAEITFEI